MDGERDCQHIAESTKRRSLREDLEVQQFAIIAGSVTDVA